MFKFLVLNGDDNFLERSKEPYDPAVLKFSAFSFKDQMLHIMDYLWLGKFPVEGLTKSKNGKSIEENLTSTNRAHQEVALYA